MQPNAALRVLVAAIMLTIAFSSCLPARVQAQAPAEATPSTNPPANEQAKWREALWERIQFLKARLEALKSKPGLADNATICEIMGIVAELLTLQMQDPKETGPAAKASGQAQATGAGNAAGDVARDQAIAAIDYASRFLKNFTTEQGNKWNRLRDSVFVPIAILLLLPGAVLAQVKAIISVGCPVVGQTNPFEGIQRSLVAVFLIPTTYLIVNYCIDFANSVQFTIATEYRRAFGTDMYRDAICAQIRAFGVRYLPENDGTLRVPPPDQTAKNNGPFSKAEGKLWGKLVDPCSGLYLVPKNRDDASMPAATIAARLMMNASNACINTCWAILCAFQMAFFYYLYFVGPIMAALWVWPIRQFRDAFPSWVEGVITLCFWSLFWHTTILLMACFKGTDDTGLFIMSALNFLATASVKHAFDFSGLVRAAGAKAAEMIEKAGKEGGGGGGGAGNKTGADTSGQGSKGGPGAGGGRTGITMVTQTKVDTPLGLQDKYKDENKDGKVDKYWDGKSWVTSDQSLFLVTSAPMPGSGPISMNPPPLANPTAVPGSNSPQYMGQPVIVDPTTGAVKMWDGMQYVERPDMRVDKDGRVAFLVNGEWVEYQSPDGNSEYRVIDGWLLNDGPGNGPDYYRVDTTGMVKPPSAGNKSEVFRNSVSSVLGESIEPIFALPKGDPAYSRSAGSYMYHFQQFLESAFDDLQEKKRAATPPPHMDMTPHLMGAGYRGEGARRLLQKLRESVETTETTVMRSFHTHSPK